MKGFRQFIMRGNVLDLAVAVVMGGAFGAVVTALVKGPITPLIAAIVGNPISQRSNSRSTEVNFCSGISSTRLSLSC